MNNFLAEAFKDASPDTSPDTSPERPSEWPELDASNFTLGVTDISHLIDPLTKLPVTRETIEGMGDLTAQLGYLNSLVRTANALLKEFEVQEGEISYDFKKAFDE